MKRYESEAIISGLGASDLGRRLGRTSLDLTLDACVAAVEDAGLTMKDIDGLTSYPGAGYPLEYSPLIAEVHDALRLELNWFRSGAEGPAPLQAVHNAVMAIATGAARHVLVYLGTSESTGQGRGGRKLKQMQGVTRLAGTHPWAMPFGAQSGANWAGALAHRHFHEFGTTREALAAVALTQRSNANVNPRAVFHDRPMTHEDYFGARMISSPLCLFDCDVPVDGAVAVVVSEASYAPDCPKTPVGFEAIGSAQHGRPSWDQRADLTRMALEDCSREMWNRTDLGPSDVDVALLYDGFSFVVLLWLEALGFCGRGEAGDFVAERGKRIARDGDLPVNTDGGQLSAGRLHGFGHLLEACTQLRGEAGERQVPGDGNGSPAQVAAVGVGAGYLSGATLLTAGVG